MSKLFQKIKRWVSGFLAIQLLAVSLSFPISVSAITGTISVKVDDLITGDTTPMITGTISDPTESIQIYLDTRTVPYDATNNGDGTWTLADNTVSALTDGIHEVIAVTASGAEDDTNKELTVDTQWPTADITSPAKNDYISGEVVIKAETLDLTPTSTKVEVVDELNQATTLYDQNDQTNYSGAVVVWDTTLFDDGEYTIRLTVLDYFNRLKIVEVGVIVDNTAPELFTVEEYEEYMESTSVAIVEPILNLLNDEGVVLTENYDEADITTNWKLVPTVEGDVATYEVTYLATDLAGNESEPVVVIVNLGTELVPEAGTNLALNGLSEVITERGNVYDDAGAHIVLAGPAAHIWTVGDVNLNKVGEYDLGYYAENPYSLAPASLETQTAPPAETRKVVVEDTVGPGAVTGLTAFAGNGYVQLSWVNPASDDLAGLDVYRSTVLGEKGIKVASALSKDATSYDDYTVVNGITYYYTVVAFDLYANNSKDSLQVSSLPMAPKVAVVTEEYYYDDGAEEVVEEQEVKSDETVEPDEDEKTESTVPVIGIIILILLIVLGLYLLYLQNPEWFRGLAFWKKRKDSKNQKPKK